MVLLPTLVDLECGLGAATEASKGVANVIAAHDSDPMVRELFSRNHPGVTLLSTKHAPECDILFVNRWATGRLVNRFNAKGVVALSEPPRDVWARYRWVKFDLNCAYYGSASARIQTVFVGLAAGSKEELDSLSRDIAAARHTRMTCVADVLSHTGLYVLPNGKKRGLFTAALPAPDLAPCHWKLAEDYTRHVTDSPGRPEDAHRFTQEEFALLRGFPRGYHIPCDRQQCVLDVSKTIPVPVARALIITVSRYVCHQRPEAMDILHSPLRKKLDRFQVIGSHGKPSVFKGNRMQVSYVTGTSSEGDAAVKEVADTGGLPPGWTITVRQNTRLTGDAVFWRDPAGEHTFRSAASVRKVLKKMAMRGR